MIDARKLRHSVDIALPGEALTDRGQVLKGTPQIVARGEPCEITTLSGRELEQARQIFGMATHRVKLRFNSAVELSPRHLLLFRGRRLNIGFVDNVGQLDRELLVLCGEEVK